MTAGGDTSSMTPHHLGYSRLLEKSTINSSRRVQHIVTTDGILFL